MTVAIIGNDAAFMECKTRLGEQHHYHHADSAFQAMDFLHSVAVIFDFSAEHDSSTITLYTSLKNTTIFLNTTFTTLDSVLSESKVSSFIFGFCGLPTFLNREVFEVSALDDKNLDELTAITHSLNLKPIVVKDQVGFVTPRVVCMIINEAYEALQQGVASREDIDLSMKLGTNYPFGPFEWSERIGVDNVRKLLKAVEMGTGDSRYRPVF